MHYSETAKHKNLKSLAKEYLLSQGFKPEEIFEEYYSEPLKVKIDVVGISPSESIAIECGMTQPERLQVLKYFFSKVIHIPYGTSILTEERLRLQIEWEKVNSLEQKKITAIIDPEIKETDIYKKAQNETYDMILAKCKLCNGYKYRSGIFRKHKNIKS